MRGIHSIPVVVGKFLIVVVGKFWDLHQPRYHGTHDGTHGMREFVTGNDLPRITIYHMGYGSASQFGQTVSLFCVIMQFMYGINLAKIAMTTMYL
jgi:hypothetical protein